MSSQDSLSKNTSTSSEDMLTTETESVSNEPTLPAVDVLERAKALRSKIQESFAKATMAMMALPLSIHCRLRSNRI